LRASQPSGALVAGASGTGKTSVVEEITSEILETPRLDMTTLRPQSYAGGPMRPDQAPDDMASGQWQDEPVSTQPSAIVTGASRGLGLALSRSLAS
jgi:hypothetical protein